MIMRKIFSLLVAALMCAGAMATTYTVVGSSEAIFGSAWDKDNTANDMIGTDSIYTLTKSDITCGKGTFEYKAIPNHQWDDNNSVPSGPNANNSYTLDKDGVYDFVFTLNVNAKTLSVEATLKGSAVVIPSIAMHGNFTGTWKDTENYTTAGDQKSASLTLSLKEGSYEFGMRIGGSGNWTANGASFTREANSAVITAGSGNLKLKADADGDYTFTWTFETNTLTITYPDVVVIPAKFYITGDSALMVDAGLDKAKAWNPDAIKSETDTFTLAGLKVGQYYVLKITIDGTWATPKGYEDLTVIADGLVSDGSDKNIGFTLQEAGDVKVIYTTETFKLEGNFKVEQIEPIVVKDLKLVPGVWTADGAKLAVWAWAGEGEGAWSAFNGEGDTLVAKIMEKADSVIFVRFSDKVVEPAWVDSLIWNRTADQEIDECGLFIVNNWDIYSWCEPAQEEVEWKEIVFNEAVAAADLPADASFEFEGLHVAITDSENKIAIDANNAYFGTADEYTKYAFRLKTGGKSQNGSKQNFITVNVPEDGLLRLAVRSGNNSDTTRTLVLAQGNDTLYNASVKDADAIEVAINDTTKIKVFPYVTVPVKAGNVDVSYPVNGLNFYAFAFVGEETKPEPVLANGYYLISDPWTVESLAETALFSANPGAEGEYMLSTTLVLNQEIKVVEVENDAVKTWFPDGMDNAYKVDSAHVGTTVIYFRPDGQGGEGWYNGYFFVTPNEGTAIDRVQGQSQSTKVLREGQLLIIRDGKTYNVIGARVR